MLESREVGGIPYYVLKTTPDSDFLNYWTLDLGWAFSVTVRDRKVEAHVFLVPPVRRAIGNDHQLRPGLGEAFDHVFVVAPFGPDVFADRNADAHAAEIDGTGRRPRREDAPFVEHAIVRQVHLPAHGGDDAAVEQAIRVVDLALL